METDKRYFFEGLFIIGFAIAAVFFALWLGSVGNRDDVLYRIQFSESVSGLSVGDAVKFHGVDVGNVAAMDLDIADPRRVRVDVALRRDAPVKTDTKASLKLKGITGVVFIELDGGDPQAPTLLAATPKGQVPEIPSESSSLNTILEALPKMIEKFSSVGDQVKDVLTDIRGLTGKISENPSLLLRAPKDKPEAKKDVSRRPER